MFEVFYVSDGELYRAANGDSQRILCGAIDNYRQTVMEIHKRHEWKTQGAGAHFMGTAAPKLEAEDIHTGVEAVVSVNGEGLIYASTLETACAIYAKNPKDAKAGEKYIAKLVDTRIYHMDYDPVDQRLVVSASEGYLEKHLALCGVDRANYRMITEGECVDITPSFSLKDPNMIYFSSAGFYMDRGRAIYSGYAVCKYDLVRNELCEVLADETHDFLYPRQTADGKLYCIRRKKQSPGRGGASLSDVILAPVRFLRAVFGWANFFSQRYSGESLIKGKGGPNPAKNREKNPREIFIEDNLIDAEKALKENKLAGETFPGIAPKSWELISIDTGGDITVIKCGVLNYTFDKNGGLVYSNGKYILRVLPDGEEIICEAEVAQSLSTREL